jgi:hypothetical protein
MDIPKDFLKQLGEVDTVLRGFFESVRKGPDALDGLQTSFNQASLAVQNLVEKATSFDALMLAMQRLAKLSQTTFSARNSALFETASVKSQQAVVADLNKVLEGYITRAKEAAEAGTLLRQVAFDSQKYIDDVRLMITEFGSGLTVSEQGIISFDRSAKSFAENRAKSFAIEQAQIQESITLAQDKYDAEERQISDLLTQKKLIIESDRQLNLAATVV